MQVPLYAWSTWRKGYVQNQHSFGHTEQRFLLRYAIDFLMNYTYN